MPPSGRSGIFSAIDDRYGQMVFSDREQSGKNHAATSRDTHESPRNGPSDADSTAFGSAIDDRSPTAWRECGDTLERSAVNRDAKPLEAPLLKKLMKASFDQQRNVENQRAAKAELAPPDQSPAQPQPSSVEPPESPKRLILPKAAFSQARSEERGHTSGELPIQSSPAFRDFARGLNEQKNRHISTKDGSQPPSSHGSDNTRERSAAKTRDRGQSNDAGEEIVSAPDQVDDQWDDFARQQADEEGSFHIRETAEAFMAGALTFTNPTVKVDGGRMQGQRSLPAEQSGRRAMPTGHTAAIDISGALDEIASQEGQSQYPESSAREPQHTVPSTDAHSRSTSQRSHAPRSMSRSPSHHVSNAATSQVSDKSSQTHISTRSLRDAIDQIDMNTQRSSARWMHNNSNVKATDRQYSIHPTVETLSDGSQKGLSDVFDEQHEVDRQFKYPSAETASGSGTHHRRSKMHMSRGLDGSRQTKFAGLGWISPHPLSVVSSGQPSHPQTFVEVKDELTGDFRQLTHKEWLQMQKHGSRGHATSRPSDAVSTRSRKPKLPPSSSPVRSKSSNHGTGHTRSDHRSIRSESSRPESAASQIVLSESTRGVSKPSDRLKSRSSPARDLAANTSRSADDWISTANEAADAYERKLSGMLNGSREASARVQRLSDEEIRLQMPWDESMRSHHSAYSTSRLTGNSEDASIFQQDETSGTNGSERTGSTRRSTHYHVHYHLPPGGSSLTGPGRAVASNASRASDRSKSSRAGSNIWKDIPVQSIEVSDTGKDDLYIPPQYRVGSVSSTTWQDLEDMEKGQGRFQPRQRKRRDTRR